MTAAACSWLAAAGVCLAAGFMDDWKAWWMKLHAENRLYFTLVTIFAVVFVGALLGILTDAVMKRLGIDLNSREVGEQ